MITEPYEQGPWVRLQGHGSKVSGHQEPLEDNPWQGRLAMCPELISETGQEQHTEVTDESQKWSMAQMYHAILYHLVYKTTQDQCEA